MQDMPPADVPVELVEQVSSETPDAGAAREPEAVGERVGGPEPIAVIRPNLPMTERADGSLVIDLTPLAPVPAECLAEEPDPFNPEIIVCRERGDSPRLGPQQGPVLDDFGNAIPRARLKLSDNAEAEANVIKKGVGGFDADGAEIKVKIEF
jgi:hypothetical protein